MFKSIEGLPADVLAIEASGRITHQDYRDILIPMAEGLTGQGSDQDALRHRARFYRL